MHYNRGSNLSFSQGKSHLPIHQISSGKPFASIRVCRDFPIARHLFPTSWCLCFMVQTYSFNHGSDSSQTWSNDLLVLSSLPGRIFRRIKVDPSPLSVILWDSQIEPFVRTFQARIKPAMLSKKNEDPSAAVLAYYFSSTCMTVVNKNVGSGSSPSERHTMATTDHIQEINRHLY